MAQQIPVLFNESLNLTAVGVAPDAIKFGATSMESDKFITVCTQDGQIVIIDMANGNQVKKRPIKAEAAIMNPKSEVLALRSGATLQVSLQNERTSKSKVLSAHQLRRSRQTDWMRSDIQPRTAGTNEEFDND